MAHKKFNSVRQTATGGAAGGALTLGAATGSKYKTLQAAGLAEGDSCYARVQNDSIDGEWENVLLTRSGGTVTRTVDSKYSNASGTTTLVDFTAGNKTISSALLADQAITADNNGDVLIPRDLVLGRNLTMAETFANAVQDAWDNDYTLNWLGGDVTIVAPIVLQAVTSKFGFGIRGNGAGINCDFNDATKYAITIEVPIVAGEVLQTIVVRNFTLQDMTFGGTTPFAGAIELRCLSNGSWINSFLMNNIVCETHSGWAYKWNGSVFECRAVSLKSTGGIGGLQIIRADNAGNGDYGLPSAMELDQPNFRDGSGSGVSLEGPAFTEPFDLSIRGGYIVTMGGNAVEAPSGITLVDGLGIEFMNGGYGLTIGYRGGVVKGGTRGANPVAGAAEGGPGMRYLVLWWGGSGQLVLEDVHYENEGSGTNMELAKIDGGSGNCYLNRAGTGSDIDTTSSGDILIADYTAIP